MSDRGNGSFVRGLPPPEPRDNQYFLDQLEVNQFPFYHGCIPMQDLEPQLINEGDFMLRSPTDPGSPTKILLTVRYKPPHMIIDIPLAVESSDGKSLVTVNGDFKKSTIGELLVEHIKEKIPVQLTKEGEKVLLIKGIARASWELPKSNVSLGEKLGEGAFGAVYQGSLKDEKGESKSVAVKVTKVCEDNKLKTDEILTEARLMRQLNHPNVVAFHGMVVDNQEVMIVMELIQGGSLDKVLKQKQLLIEDKCNFCYDIASGLAYLHANGFMHRDMAARNCLLDEVGKVVKISDFGMSKQGDNYKMAPTERTPIRWQAPELMRTAVYTKPCDVYSFGMTLYEIFSDGKIPFDGVKNADLRKKIQNPKFRPELPANVPKNIQQIIHSTWLPNPSNRPTMRDCADRLKRHAVVKQVVSNPRRKIPLLVRHSGSVDKSKSPPKKQSPVQPAGAPVTPGAVRQRPTTNQMGSKGSNEVATPKGNLIKSEERPRKVKKEKGKEERKESKEKDKKKKR